MHHTGSQQETTVVKVGEQEGGFQQDVLAQEVHMDGEPGEELQECPDHQPSSFKRGKSWSISLPMVCKSLTLLPLCLMH
jgi:hypothetical protein